MAEQIKLTVPIDQLADTKCECGNETFTMTLRLKVLPALYSQTGKPEHIMLQMGFTCTACGKLIPLSPVDKTDQKILTFPSREN